MKINSRKFLVSGFTLIELLIAIAIIGILTSIVMVSLGGAKGRGSDAAIIADLANVSLSAETLFEDFGQKYRQSSGSAITSSTCSTFTPSSNPTQIFEDITVNNALRHALAQSGSDSDCGITSDGSAYSIAAPLKSGGAYCVDSLRTSRSTTLGGVAYTAVSGSATAAHTTSGQTTCN